MDSSWSETLSASPSKGAATMLREQLINTLTDPSSGQGSMSRLNYGMIILGILALSAWMIHQGKQADAIDLLKMALLTTGGIYGSNSVVGVINRAKGNQSPTGPPQGPPAG